eukprot:scaffold22680_cov107-Cylindrotheca_fusiformis.AAC.26
MTNPQSEPFPFKLHAMLNNAETEGYSDIISWQGDHCFKVHDKDAFVESIIPRYFSQTQYRSFQRMLNMWGFHRLREEPFKGAYTHEYLKRGDTSLCKLMRCQKVKKISNTKLQAPGMYHGAQSSRDQGQSLASHILASDTAEFPRTAPAVATLPPSRSTEPNSPEDPFEGKSFHMVPPKDHDL